MRPTLDIGDLIVVLPGTVVQPRIGSVVVVRDPREPARETVKRVVAGAGEPADLGGDVRIVPVGHLAVRGDAAAASTDSRHYGPVRADLVTGRVVGRVWPRPTLLS